MAERSCAIFEIGHGGLFFWDWVPCIRRHASAGHLVVHSVTGPMFRDRWFSGTAMLGASFSTSSAHHPLWIPPTGSVLPDALSTVYWFASPVRPDVAASLWPAVPAEAYSSQPRLPQEMGGFPLTVLRFHSRMWFPSVSCIILADIPWSSSCAQGKWIPTALNKGRHFSLHCDNVLLIETVVGLASSSYF